MIRRRASPDGLPFRVYERIGTRTYSIGYKAADGRWKFRFQCPVSDLKERDRIKREALVMAATANQDKPPEGTFAFLADSWFAWQESLPAGTAGKRTEQTLKENKRELKNLKRAFGHMHLDQMTKADAYDYLAACFLAKDSQGKSRPRVAKGNKEISLARTVLEHGIRRGWLKANPFDNVVKAPTSPKYRYVTDQELNLAVEVGRRMGGPQHIVAMALRTAFLCVRRSVEVRALTRDQIQDNGIAWVAAKRQHSEAIKVGLIEWSPELKDTITEALSIQRHKLAGSWYVFGNLNGQKYTKGGWKATLAKLMAECVLEAKKKDIVFQPFSLQDCRPKGVTDKLSRGDQDVQDATMHSSERMVRQVYDRRRIRKAKPAR